MTTHSARPVPSEKECTTCSHVKPLTEFHKAKTGLYGVRGDCKQCKNASKRSNRAGPDRQKIKDQEHDMWLRRTYGVTLQDYYLMLEDQGGKCAICATSEPGRGKDRFCIDHCHTTGKVRGLLCMPCNVSIGHLKDNVQLIENALNYVKVHSNHVP